jgi:hypothetical protein
MFSIWKINELSLIDELNETENQFILFPKNDYNNPLAWISQKNGIKNVQLWVKARLNNPKKIKWHHLLGFWVQAKILSTIGLSNVLPLCFLAWQFNACNNFYLFL